MRAPRRKTRGTQLARSQSPRPRSVRRALPANAALARNTSLSDAHHNSGRPRSVIIVGADGHSDRTRKARSGPRPRPSRFMAWRWVMPAACNSRTADGARTADRRAAFFHRTACPPADIARDYLKGWPCTALEKNCTKSPKRFKAGWKPVTSPADNPLHCGTSVNLVHSQPPLRGGQVFKGKVSKLKGKGLERKILARTVFERTTAIAVPMRTRRRLHS